jgi:hypothetical protein
LYEKKCNYTIDCQEFKTRLTCSNGKCLCSSNTYWNGVECAQAIDYLGGCQSNSECNINQNLFCSPNSMTCVCANNLYWKSSLSKCVNYSSLNENCNSNDECLANSFLSCNAVSKKCDCPLDRYWSEIHKQCCKLFFLFFFKQQMLF